MRCAAVSIGWSPAKIRTKAATGRKSALLRVQMASTYSVWVEPTGDIPGTAVACVHVPYSLQQQDCRAVLHKLQWCDTGTLASQLQHQINSLAEAYDGPTFPPHVTLVGGVTGSEQQVLDTAKQLAGIIKVQGSSFPEFPQLLSFPTPWRYNLCQFAAECRLR